MTTITTRSRGFTLIELMIGLVLVAILLGIGLPSFRSFILNQQLRATTSDLRMALTLARSEAVKRNRMVELQASDEGEGWGSGWSIPSPNVGDGDLLSHQQKGDITIATEPDVDSVDFTPMGRAVGAVAFTVSVGPPGSNVQGCMQIALDGRIESSEGVCADD